VSDPVGDAIRQAVARRIASGGAEDELIGQMLDEGKIKVRRLVKSGLIETDAWWEAEQLKMKSATPPIAKDSVEWKAKERVYKLLVKADEDMLKNR